MRVDPKKMIEALRSVIKWLHFPAEVMLVWVRWYWPTLGACATWRK